MFISKEIKVGAPKSPVLSGQHLYSMADNHASSFETVAAGSSVELLESEISVGEATVSISHPDWETAAAEGWDRISINL